jgi:hypothetical protein
MFNLFVARRFFFLKHNSKGILTATATAVAKRAFLIFLSFHEWMGQQHKYHLQLKIMC